jgi:hypothetical protein
MTHQTLSSVRKYYDGQTRREPSHFSKRLSSILACRIATEQNERILLSVFLQTGHGLRLGVANG